jgi:hypothetical protein
MSVLPNVAIRSELSGINSLSAIGEVSVGLYTAPTTINDTISLGSLTQPTFLGYAPQVSTPVHLSGGPMVSLSALSLSPVTFTCTAVSAAQTVQGAYVWVNNPASAVQDLLGLIPLPGGPLVVSQPGDSIRAQCTITTQRAPGQS